MKKLLYLFTLSFLFPIFSHASHISGGTIGWQCLSNGQYRFEMEVYRDCVGIPYAYGNETIRISGAPLPTDASGLPITSITVKPDSNRWNQNNNGDFAAQCKNGGGFSCASGDNGTLQVFWYISDPITLSGVPPASSWTFSWQGPPVRSEQIENIVGNGQLMGLQAKMFPLPNNQNTNPCYDSSPIFRGSPTSFICRDYTFTYNHVVIDLDLDSSVFSLGTPYNQMVAGGVLTPVTYRPPYSANNPTPDASQNANNIPYTLDPITGVTRLAIFSGNGVQKFATAVRVDSYRDGVVIASVYREFNLAVGTCAPLTNGNVNQPPIVYINGKNVESEVLDVVAGQLVQTPIQVIDNDVTSSGLQSVTMIPDGLLFTATRGPSTNPMATTPRQKGSPCQIPGIEPCAYLQNLTPSLDSFLVPQAYAIRNLGSIQAEFVWQTDCSHIMDQRGIPGTNEGIYNFVMRVLDDHCPLPKINYPTITVRVKDPIPLAEPIMKGISVNLDGSVEYNWVAPWDSVHQFEKYEVEGTRIRTNFPLGAWSSINGNVDNYAYKKLANNFPVYELIDPFGPSDGAIDVFRVLGTSTGVELDFYMRMRTISGCSDTASSIFSDPAQVMELEVLPESNQRTSASLKWNRSKANTSSTSSYLLYESPTKYYIHANDSVSNGKVQDASSWYLVGETYDTTFIAKGSLCNDYVAYRIESRDTVRAYAPGNGVGDSIIEYTFSTFSTIDSLFLSGGEPSIVNQNNTALETDLVRNRIQWMDANTNAIISGEIGRSFIPKQQGDYKVIVSEQLNSQLCSDTSAAFSTIQLSDSVAVFNNDSLVAQTNGVQYQWINCRTNQAIIGANEQSYVPNDTGLYQVVVTAYAYSDTSDCVAILAIGLTENNLQTNTSIFPNPNKGVFYLRGLVSGDTYQISIWNTQGQLIREQNVSNQQQLALNLEGGAGVYFIQLRNKKGEQANFKVIKQ